MPWIRAISLSSLIALLLLAACENASEPAPESKQRPGTPILGIEWREKLPSGFHYMAGSTLTLTLYDDSAVIVEEKFTDYSTCAVNDADKLCSDFWWSNRYIGSYVIDDSLLTLSYAFAGTTANRLTDDEHLAEGATASRYRWEAGNPGLLILDGIGDGEVFPGRKTMELTAKVRSQVE